ncbi:PREDICTED: uncharacterized protein LOC108558384 [Nicrophorus vespilloides]|uniref:Uncharacterized protein LOC108558384 n=1 Tax=Nicrophorus vespilloides TaxID=110193 RepID=A0ABM1M877_NICVS|nr:PREDICTED: uncharacterized protein LOC108558384 [Nicrophorus vespilloides]
MHGISPTTPPSYPTFAYPRRVSPPGSPAPKKCCYDHAETYRNRESFLCCCYTCPKRSSTSVFATVAVCCMVLGYTILGAFVFMALEGGFRRDTSIAASKSSLKREGGGVAGDLRSQTVERLWSITENLNILYRENWTRLAAEEVMEFQEALFRALRSGAGYVGPGDSTILYHQHPHRWSFSSSFLYSLTLITTIGFLRPCSCVEQGVLQSNCSDVSSVFIGCTDDRAIRFVKRNHLYRK